MTFKRIYFIIAISLLLPATLAACIGSPNAPAASGSAISTRQAGDKLQVVATTTIVGDIVHQVGGDAINLTVLLPVGSDPHGFQPTPQDVAKVADADVIFINGLGMEQFLDRLVQSAGGKAKVVAVSDGVATIEPAGDSSHEEDSASDTSQAGDAHADEHEHGVDPHVFTDPNNIRVWTKNIAAALSELDPANAATYKANAERYDQELQVLDTWIKEQVAQVPPANREMVVDHDVFGYLARRYGLNTVGTVVPGYNTMAEPSAQELAALEDSIRQLGAKAVFVGNTVNPALSERVAKDTGTALVFNYTDSLSDPGGEADSYVKYMRYNVASIVNALK